MRQKEEFHMDNVCQLVHDLFNMRHQTIFFKFFKMFACLGWDFSSAEEDSTIGE